MHVASLHHPIRFRTISIDALAKPEFGEERGVCRLLHLAARYARSLPVGFPLALVHMLELVSEMASATPAQPPNTPVSMLEPFQAPGTAFLANPTPLQGPACDNVTLGAQLIFRRPATLTKLSAVRHTYGIIYLRNQQPSCSLVLPSSASVPM